MIVIVYNYTCACTVSIKYSACVYWHVIMIVCIDNYVYIETVIVLQLMCVKSCVVCVLQGDLIS